MVFSPEGTTEFNPTDTIQRPSLDAVCVAGYYSVRL